METLRTRDERFENLPGWPYTPRYVEISDGLRVHYVDEGPSDGPVVLLAHGEPSWSYLYRKMIPLLVDAGCRTVAFDLVGFGRSDKPAAQDDYSYEGHVGWFDETVRGIGLRDITLFGQDWGGMVGLAHVVLHPVLYRGVVASNTGLMPGIDHELPEVTVRWKEYARQDPFDVGEIIGGDSPLNNNGYSGLSDDEKRAYNAPFPDERYRAGARVFPQLIPSTADHPSAPFCRSLFAGPLQACEVPLLTAFGSLDTVTLPAEPAVQMFFKGAEGQPHRTIEGAGHFIQEHAPGECVQAILDLLGRTSRLAR